MIKPIGIFDEETRDISGISQMNQGVRNACGVACMLMLLRDCGLAQSESVAEWSKKIDAGQDGTTSADLARMAQQSDGIPELGPQAAYPYIELVRYADLSIKHPQFANASFLHWIVRESDTTYFDPLWPSAQCHRREVLKTELDEAEVEGAKHRVGISNPRILPSGDEISPTGTTRTDGKFVAHITAQSWRVRSAPDKAAPTIGALTFGETFNGIAVVSDGLNQWAVVRLSVGGAGLYELDEKTLNTNGLAEGYILFGPGWSKSG